MVTEMNAAPFLMNCAECNHLFLLGAFLPTSQLTCLAEQHYYFFVRVPSLRTYDYFCSFPERFLHPNHHHWSMLWHDMQCCVLSWNKVVEFVVKFGGPSFLPFSVKQISVQIYTLDFVPACTKFITKKVKFDQNRKVCVKAFKSHRLTEIKWLYWSG